MIADFLAWLEATPFSQFIHESAYGFPAVECVHVVAITLVFGTIMIVDLRLLGWASIGVRVTALTREILPLTWGAFALAVVTGSLLFVSQPVEYVANTAFRLKMLALVAAGLNMAAFHAVGYRSVASWDAQTPPPARARWAGALSLVCWTAVISCGRIIGFTMFPG
jgi:hypothetical protein